MKLLYFLILLASLSLSILPQELYFDDMLYLVTNSADLDKCDSFLAKKGFAFVEIIEQTLVFAKDRINNERAECLFYIFKDAVQLRSLKRITFDYFKNTVAANSMKLVETEAAKSGELHFFYKNNSHLLVLSQKVNPDGAGNIYTIYLCTL